MHISYTFSSGEAPPRGDRAEVLGEALLPEEGGYFGSPDAGQLHGVGVLNGGEQPLARGGPEKLELLGFSLGGVLNVSLGKEIR